MKVKTESQDSRFFISQIPPATPQASARVELSTSESHHAMHVLRLGAGDSVELLDGRGRTAAGRIVQTKRGVVTVEVAGEAQAHQRPGPEVHLAFAVPKGKRLDWLLEKATELGAASLRPIAFERSVAGGDNLGEGKKERWQTHCVAAAKQSGMNFLPEIHDVLDVGQLAARFRERRVEEAGNPVALEPLGVVGDLSPGVKPLREVLNGRQGAQPVLLVVGPEGGITEAELQLLSAAGIRPAKLGHTILRIETAAVALLAATMAILPDG
jgi:16S rRNA (uracil1498-N3)-methyltransferase